MKKFILGLLVGISVTMAGSAYADDITQSIIGKKIDGEFPIKISGKQLNTNAAVIEGTSYLPVRAIGEALNMDVSFNADMGIELTEKGDVKVTETQPISTPQTPAAMTKEEIESKIGYYNSQIRIANIDIGITEDNIKQNPDKTSELQKNIETLKLRIADYESQIAALEAQK